MFSVQRCPDHYHLIKNETFFILQGIVEMSAGNRHFVMKVGDVFKMKPPVKHTFKAINGHALILEVSLPSVMGDNIFDDEAGKAIIFN